MLTVIPDKSFQGMNPHSAAAAADTLPPNDILIIFKIIKHFRFLILTTVNTNNLLDNIY